MKKVEHTFNGSLLVHYDNPIGDSYALCGQDTSGDDVYGDIWDSAIPSNKRVNCPNCIIIRDYVRGKTT